MPKIEAANRMITAPLNAVNPPVSKKYCGAAIRE
jgi:hypothetical protein